MKLGLAAAKLAKFSGNGSPTDALLKLL
jgi:hypothetical protein